MNENHGSLTNQLDFNRWWCQERTLAIKKLDVTTLAVQQQVNAMMMIVGLFGDQTIIVATTAADTA